MSRLTPEEQKEYEEEQEYHNSHQAINIPDKRNPTAYERIKSAARNVGTQVQKFDQGPTGQALRQHAQRINAQGNGGSRGRSQGNNPMTGYARFSNDSPDQGPPVNQGSALHPGNRILVVEGRVLASAGTPGSAPRESRRRGRGGLGGANPGFGNDNGL